MKSKGNFKLSKPTKSFLATIIDPHLRSEIKRAMVNAELSATLQPKISKNRKDASQDKSLGD